MDENTTNDDLEFKRVRRRTRKEIEKRGTRSVPKPKSSSKKKPKKEVANKEKVNNEVDEKKDVLDEIVVEALHDEKGDMESLLDGDTIEEVESEEDVKPATEFYNEFNSSFQINTIKDPFAKFILKGIKSGKKTVYNKTIRENRVFEEDYIKILEDAYPCICKILRNPKSSIRYEEEVVLVEKAKKVNSMTIRHLASHTQLIKKIEDNGDVIPSKVLTTYAEEELAIYENRFIKTLINRIDKFLEYRYQIIGENLESYQSDRIKVTNQFKVDKKDVSITVDVAVRKDIEESVTKAKEAYDRIAYLRDQYRGLKSTEFMRALAKARPVLPPIMKTNVILHNPDFKTAYALWLYLDRYDGLGYDLKVKERNHEYKHDLSDDIDNIMAVSFATAMHHRRIGNIDVKPVTLKETVFKKPKEERHLPDEFTMKPGNYQVEKNAINEYFLSETAKYFNSSLRNLQREGSGETQSLRVVYKQMLEIIDNIYPTVFDSRETAIEDSDNKYTLEEKLEMARKRQRVLRIVREQKELNLARMEKLEEKATKDIYSLENKMALASARAQAREQRERERELRIAEANKLKEQKAKEKQQAQIKKQQEINKAKEKALLEKQKAKEKEALKKAKQREKEKEKARLKREQMKTSKRRNIKARKKRFI